MIGTAGEMMLRSGDVLDVLGREHRVAAVTSDFALLIDLRSHHVFLIQDEAGRISLPTPARIRQMLDDGKAKAVAIPTLSTPSIATERMRVELELLDAAEVRNGTKAIFLWLDANWSDDLRRRYGDFDDAATIKRWRTEQRRLRDAERR